MSCVINNGSINDDVMTIVIAIQYYQSAYSSHYLVHQPILYCTILNETQLLLEKYQVCVKCSSCKCVNTWTSSVNLDELFVHVNFLSIITARLYQSIASYLWHKLI